MKTLKRVLGKSKTLSTSAVDDEYRKRHSTKFRDVLERLKAVSKDRKKRFHEFDAIPENLIFLQDIRFFNELRSLYPNVEVNIDIENGKLFLRGDSEEFNDAYNKCSWTLQKIAKGSLPFDDERIWDVIADSRVQEHLKSIISSKNIKAQVCFCFNLLSYCALVHLRCSLLFH